MHSAKKLTRQAISMNSRYHAGLVAFKKRCTDYSSIKKFLDDVFEKQEFKAFLQTQSKVQIADIGCGDGAITEYLVKMLTGTTLHKIQLDVVEPINDYVALTKARLNPFRGLNFEVSYHPTRAEDYFQPLTAAQYDFVFSSHSLHLMPLTALDDIASALKPGGYFVVVIGARTSIMSTLKDLFVFQPAITGEDILRVMKEQHPEFEVEKTSQPSFLDLRGVDLPENKADLTEETKNILSLMVQKNIDDVDQAGYTKARQLILEKLEDGQLRLDNDGFVFRRSMRLN